MTRDLSGDVNASWERTTPELTEEQQELVLGTIYSRHTNRLAFKNCVVPIEVINNILAAGESAPSSKNAKPWRFHLVSDKDKIKDLARMMFEHPEAEQYVPRDLETGEPKPDWLSTVDESAALLALAPSAIIVENSGNFSGGRITVASAPDELRSGALITYALEMMGVGAAIENMVLAAHAQGLGVAFMGDIQIAEDQIREVYGIEGDICGVMCFGYTEEGQYMPTKTPLAGMPETIKRSRGYDS